MMQPTPVGRGRFAVPGNRWDLLDAAVGLDPVDVSVVIPYYDNQHDLDLVLAALSVQTHPGSRLQVVVADDGSPQPPRVPDLAGELTVVVARQDDAGFRAGAARNLGVRQSDGTVILFLDGDSVPTPDYVEKLGRLPARLPDAVVSGRRRYADLSRWGPRELLPWFAGRIAPPRQQWDEPEWLTNEYVRSGNLLAIHPRSYKYQIGAVLGCSREFFDEIGGFDETITGYGGEDYDFTYRAYNAGAVLAYVPDAVAWHDGPDWSGRTDPSLQTAQKNREVMMLAERIPEPSMRGTGQVYPVVDIVITVCADQWSLGAAVLCVRSLLTVLDCGIWIDGTDHGAQALRRCFRSDPRVHPAPPDDVADRYTKARARLRMQVLSPFAAGPALADILTRMLEEDWGTLTVHADEEPIAEITSTRAWTRTRRYPPAAPDGDPWFAHHRLDGQDCGVTPIVAEPRLGAVFGGYA